LGLGRALGLLGRALGYPLLRAYSLQYNVGRRVLGLGTRREVGL